MVATVLPLRSHIRPLGLVFVLIAAGCITSGHGLNGASGADAAPSGEASALPQCPRAGTLDAAVANQEGADASADAEDATASSPTTPGLCADGWCWWNPQPQGNDLRSIWGSASDDIWSVGASTILHWDGSSWSLSASDLSWQLEAVWGSASDDVWAVGLGGTSVHWDGQTWSPVATGVAVDLHAIWGSGPGDIWAAGAADTVIHYDGAKWTLFDASAPEDASEMPTFVGLWGADANDVWLVGLGTAGPGIMRHWNG